MFHHGHELVANCVRLLFGSVQITHWGLEGLSLQRQLPAAAENSADDDEKRLKQLKNEESFYGRILVFCLLMDKHAHCTRLTRFTFLPGLT